jgi:hypothetical protein
MPSLKEIADIYQAASEGKVVQYRPIPEHRSVEDWYTSNLITVFPYLNDLKEWRIKPEPVMVECWVNVYENKEFFYYRTKELADKGAGKNRQACIKLVGQLEL